MTAPTLYFTSDRASFFLVPPGVELAEGPVTIRSLGGHERNVEPEALLAYEVDRETAEAHLKQHLTAGAERFFENLRRVGAGLIRPRPAPRDDGSEDAPDPGQEAAKGLEDLADWISGGLRSLADRIRERSPKE